MTPRCPAWVTEWMLVLITEIVLTGAAQLVGPHSAKQEVSSSFPGWSTCLDCGFGP